MGIAVASFLAALYVFKGQIPREVMLVLFAIAFVATSKLLQDL